MFSNVLKGVCRKLYQQSSRRMSEIKVSTEEKIAAMSPTELIKNTVKVSDWNKRIMVFAGTYKNMADIPDRLPYDKVAKARDWARVRTCNIMMVLALIAFIINGYRGKKAHERGESVASMNLEWHRQYNEQARKQEEAAAAAAAAAAKH